MTLNYILIGKRIREIRKRKKISQAALSDMVDITPTFISYIESGLKGMSIETLVAISNALGVTTDAILADSITGISSSSSYDVTEILNDCSSFERSVIIASMKNLKTTIRENRNLIKSLLG